MWGIIVLSWGTVASSAATAIWVHIRTRWRKLTVRIWSVVLIKWLRFWLRGLSWRKRSSIWSWLIHLRGNVKLLWARLSCRVIMPLSSIGVSFGRNHMVSETFSSTRSFAPRGDKSLVFYSLVFSWIFHRLSFEMRIDLSFWNGEETILVVDIWRRALKSCKICRIVNGAHILLGQALRTTVLVHHSLGGWDFFLSGRLTWKEIDGANIWGGIEIARGLSLKLLGAGIVLYVLCHIIDNFLTI